MKDNNYLYIFLHIPKCAGSTFRYHINKNFSKEEVLFLTLELQNKYGRAIEDIDLYKRKVDEYLNELSDIDKSKIKIIFGHKVPYGIHKHFDRPYRYFTFFREPIKRTISIYNHYKSDYQILLKEGRAKIGLKKNFILDSKSPNFEKWLVKKYCPDPIKQSNLTMCGFLKLWGYVNNESTKSEDYEKDLKKFFYIATVENYENDSLYLCDKLGINKFFTDKNISVKHFKLKDNPKLKKEIVKRNTCDIKIYKSALKVSKDLREKIKDYDISVSRARKRRILLPLTQAIFAPRETLGIFKAMLTGKKDVVFLKR